MPDRDALIQELEGLGDEIVAERLQQGIYKNAETKGIIIAWLERKKEERAEKRYRETRDIAESAASATKSQAETSKWALWIAILAAFIGVLSLFANLGSSGE